MTLFARIFPILTSYFPVGRKRERQTVGERQGRTCEHRFRVADNTQRGERAKTEGKKELIVSHVDVDIDIRRRGG